jgi:iron-sulfur cluster assembly enzyme ISCU, mitochondrial
MRSYHEKVLDHYERPRNTGSLPKADIDVGTGLVGAPACGDVMKLQIRVDPESQVISDVRFKTFGCGSAIASSSYLTELVKGMTLEEAARVKNTDIARELCLPPVKRKCHLLQPLPVTSRVQPEADLAYVNSALLHAGPRRHPVCHLQLLFKEPPCQDDGP